MAVLRGDAFLRRSNSLVALGAVLLLCVSVGSATWTSPCSPGEFKGDSGACEKCEPGSHSPYGHNCTECAVGYFANSSGSTSCAACALEFGHSYTSSVGASTCDKCVEENYRGLDDECYPCVIGMDCSEAGRTLKNVVILPGWFRFRNDSAAVYSCPNNNCEGGGAGDGSCTASATGPLCITCAEESYMHASSKCRLCDKIFTDVFVWATVGVVALLVVVAVGMLICGQRVLASAMAWYRQPKNEKACFEVSERLTAMFVMMQTLILVVKNYNPFNNHVGETVPGPYNSFLQLFDFMALDALDIFPLKCLWWAPVDHFDYMIMETAIAPAVLGVGVFGTLLFKGACSRRSAAQVPDAEKGRTHGGGSNLVGSTSRPPPGGSGIGPVKGNGGHFNGRVPGLSEEANKRLAAAKAAEIRAHRDNIILRKRMTRRMGYFLQLLVLLLPIIARRICESFSCETFQVGPGEDDVKQFLTVDVQIDCSSNRYRMMLIYAIVALTVYAAGVPIVLMVSLYKIRDRLNPTDHKFEVDAIKFRAEDPAIVNSSIAPLVLHYRPKLWWYVGVSIMTRLLLTCMSLLLTSKYNRILFVLCILLMATVTEREINPFLNGSLNKFVYFFHQQIILCTLVVLVRDAHNGKDPDKPFEIFGGQTTVGITLVVTNAVLMLSTFWPLESSRSTNLISVSSWRKKLHRTLSSPAKSLSRLTSWRPGSPNQRNYNGSKFEPSPGGRRGRHELETGTELPRWGWGRRKAKAKQQGHAEEKDGASSSSSSTPVQSFRSSRNPLDNSFSKSISSHSGSVDEGHLSLDRADVINVHSFDGFDELEEDNMSVTSSERTRSHASSAASTRTGREESVERGGTRRGHVDSDVDSVLSAESMTGDAQHHARTSAATATAKGNCGSTQSVSGARTTSVGKPSKSSRPSWLSRALGGGGGGGADGSETGAGATMGADPPPMHSNQRAMSSAAAPSAGSSLRRDWAMGTSPPTVHGGSTMQKDRTKSMGAGGSKIKVPNSWIREDRSAAEAGGAGGAGRESPGDASTASERTASPVVSPSSSTSSPPKGPGLLSFSATFGRGRGSVASPSSRLSEAVDGAAATEPRESAAGARSSPPTLADEPPPAVTLLQERSSTQSMGGAEGEDRDDSWERCQSHGQSNAKRPSVRTSVSAPGGLGLGVVSEKDEQRTDEKQRAQTS